MKNLSILLVTMISLLPFTASADQTWIVSSKSMTESPMDYMNIRSKVMASYSAFGAFNSNLGAMKSWECKITQKTKANANPTHPYLDVCVLNLELPADWDYSGSFNLTLGFDAFSATVTSLKYEWVK